MIRHYKVAIAICILALIPAISGYAQYRGANQQRNKSRSQLIEENTMMMDQLDSLEALIRKLRIDLDMAQSEKLEEKVKLGLSDIRTEDYTEDVTDSLLSIWYHHQQLSSVKEEDYDMDVVKFTSNVPDKVMLERLEKINSYITLPFNETVKNYIVLYSEKMPSRMSSMLALSQYYMPIFEETFNKYGLPEELKYMAIIESALNPTAVSKAGAKGTWQFMHQTAKSYGLEINSYVDERFDTFKAADAAARYLRDSYKIFGDWNLAISSYNCGSGNVSKAIRRAGGRNDFWSIYDYLPKETRGYVPAFVGAMYAFAYYKEYGIKPGAASMPAHVDTFEIKKPLHFKQVSELVGIPMDDLHNLNPQYIHDIIPGGKTYILRIPYNYSSAFVAQEDSVYNYKASEFLPQATLQNIKNGVYNATSTSSNGTVETRVAYKVKSGDTLGKIASKNKTTVAKLKSWNHLKSDKLKVGQIIYIYKYTAAPKTASTTTTTTASSKSASTAKPAENASKTTETSASADSTAKAASDSTDAAVAEKAGSKEEVKEKQQAEDTKKDDGPEYIEYKIVAGDTVYKISKKFNVNANEIMEYNKIDANIKQGQIIRIPIKK